ncbi:phage tail tape measure protein [Alistipes putredinis]|uniref:phage tail tape measure protein n=1 Tax=Alistipes putredinis TaxID=28117 RepID=UPI002672786E|nr:phage tail tape measure protein [Alistipes putredinis]
MAANTLKLAFILSATDKMSRIIDEAVKKSTNKLSAFERTTGKIGRSMTKAGTVMLGASAAVGGSILAVGKSTADYAGDMYDMARGAGIGVEAFQKLAYAGRMSGVETEKLSASLVKFDRMVAEATGGNKTYMQTFEDLGIKIKDSAGNLRQPNEIFEDVADIFHNTEDGIGKTALAVELFGKSGADLIPMLNDGKAGLKAFYAEAERLGLALSNEMIAKGDAFSDQLENIGEQVKGVKLQLGAALIPALSAATEKISKVIDKITKWVQENPELAATIGNIAMTTGKWIAILGTAAIAISSVAFIILQFRKAFRAMSDAVTIGISIFKNIKNTFLVVDKAMKGYTKTQKLATVATKLFNKALKANPILTIISLIIALGAVVYSVIKNWDKIAAWFKKLWDAIVGIFKAAWEAIKKVWSTVTGWFSNLWGGIKAGAGKAWEGIKNTINKAREGVQKAWGSVKGWFSNLWGNVKSGISNAWGGIKDWFSNLQPVEWMRGAWENVGTFFENLGPRFYEWGKNLLQGLWNGITSMVDKIVEGMKNIGRRIANGFKSILGINSPSRLFAEYGLNITQGLVVGLDRGGAIVENATEGVAMQATRGITQSMQSSTVNTSTIVGGRNTGPSITYAPQITFAGSTTREARDEFGKMLKQHANEIMELIRKYEENKTRLSFA